MLTLADGCCWGWRKFDGRCILCHSLAAPLSAVAGITCRHRMLLPTAVGLVVLALGSAATGAGQGGA